MTIRVFEINDMEWWAGDCTPDEILLAYMAYNGVTHEDATGDIDDYPTPLSELQLAAMVFNDVDEMGNTIKVSFKEQLNRMIAANTEFPTFFAASES